MIKFFKKLGNIIEGWFKYLFKPQSELAKKRLEICRECPHRITIAGEDICSKCFCGIYAKAEVADEICYDGRWNDIKINENENE